jgi:hypothetical protein
MTHLSIFAQAKCKIGHSQPCFAELKSAFGAKGRKWLVVIVVDGCGYVAGTLNPHCQTAGLWS